MQTAKEIISTPHTASEPCVAAIVVNYNCYEDTKSCVESLLASNYRNLCVIVIDNDSPDGSGEKLKKSICGERVKVILSPQNGGFAGGNNLGFKLAMHSGAELLWLVNADATVECNALSQLVRCLNEHPEVAATGSKILYANNTDRHDRTPEQSGADLIWGAGGEIDFAKHEVRMRGWRELDSGQFDALRECDYLPGCSLLVRKSVVDEVGLLPEDYFMYFEETDWCNRMRKKGHKLLYAPKSIVWHDFSEAQKQTSAMVYYYNRASLIFWYRNAYGLARLKYKIRVLLKDLLRAQKAFGASRSDAQREIFRAHRASCVDFLLGRLGKRY